MTDDGRRSMPALNGSATEIANATRIRDDIDAEFDRVRASIEAESNKNRPLDRSETICLLALIEEHRAAVLSNVDAAYFVNHSHDVGRAERLLHEDKRWKVVQEARSARRARSEAANPIRYLGFDDAASVRVFKFGRLPAHDGMEIFTVSVPVELFLKHRIAFQDGPAMCSAVMAASAEPKNHMLEDADGLEFIARRPVKAERKPPRQKHVQPE